MSRTWDVFCSVVDNYGDIGICWRLARQLAMELQQSVRLWVDDLASFHRLCPSVDPASAVQHASKVEIRHWGNTFPRIEPADIVIEGFGMRLPDAYIAAMAAREPHPVWINLEYLSAEGWVEGCHGLPSRHPTLPLIKHFFFPGFTAATGGLLIEDDLTETRNAFQCDPVAIESFWRSLDLAPAASEAVIVSLFCYDNAALPALVEAWSSDALPVVCIVPEGVAYAQLSRISRRPIAIGADIKLGRLTIHAVPFLELDRYDRLLWACDINFVRGEDSFVRAQLASRPLVWQAYPQDEAAHLRKASAFLGRYVRGLDGHARATYIDFCDAWNRQSADAGSHWVALRFHRMALTAHAGNWAAQLATGGSLALKLAEFCEDRLKSSVFQLI